MSEVLTTSEVAARLRVSPWFVRRMIKSGELPALKSRNGRVIRVAVEAVDQLLGAGGSETTNREDQ